MYEHAEVDQQRVDALAVRRRDRETLQRIGEEHYYAEEEGEHESENAGGVGRRAREAAPRGQHRQNRQQSQDQGQEEERPRVPGVEGDPGVGARHREVAVLGHVSNGEVASDEGVYEGERSDDEKHGQRVQPVAAAEAELGNSLPRADQGGDGHVPRDHEADYQGYLSGLNHPAAPWGLPTPRRGTRPALSLHRRPGPPLFG